MLVLTNSLSENLALAGILLVAGLIVAAVGYVLYKSRTYHYCEIDPRKLYRDGCRHSLQFARSCRRGKIKTVVSLIGDNEVISDRFAGALAKARGQGAQTLQVVIPLGGWPSTENIRQFLDIMANSANHPVLVHCREGVRRTGMMVSAYRLSVMGLTRQQAKDALETFGHSRRSIGDVEHFIDLYDPQRKEVIYTGSEAPSAV